MLPVLNLATIGYLHTKSENFDLIFLCRAGDRHLVDLYVVVQRVAFPLDLGGDALFLTHKPLIVHFKNG